MPASPPLVTLLTDFGIQGSYVGAMKGVILTITPHAHLVDITHQISPQNVREAALALLNIYRYYPKDTVHMIVVDPGVGSTRRPIAVATDHGIYVAPDNGVLSYVLKNYNTFDAVVIKNPAYMLPEPSHTFHGRDIFSPAAAHLAGGVALNKLGPAISDLIWLEMPVPVLEKDSIQGEILTVDHFGNALSNIQLRWKNDETVVFVQGGSERRLEFAAKKVAITAGDWQGNGLKHAYSAVEIGRPLALISSSGALEVAMNQGNAGQTLGISVGDPVRLYLNTD